MTEKERLLKEIKELQEQVDKMDENAEILDPNKPESMDKVWEYLTDRFETIGQEFRVDTYKGYKKDYDMGAWESEKKFVEKVIKKKHFEDLAAADGFNLDNPSDEILPQKQALRDEIASKSAERNMFDAEVEYHSAMAANYLSGLGPVGEAIGLGVGSVFGAVTGAVEALKLSL